RLVTGLAFYLLVAGIVVQAAFPFYYAVTTSLKSGSALFVVDYLPTQAGLANYVAVLTNGLFATNILNSVLVAVIVVCLAMLLAVT
ncbi:hypothetical protein J8J40_31180, partial [Mycobacterium tuberculosis]|nr:hypothetical protein [Mycobacterium tuberculosis]